MTTLSINNHISPVPYEDEDVDNMWESRNQCQSPECKNIGEYNVEINWNTFRYLCDYHFDIWEGNQSSEMLARCPKCGCQFRS